MTTDDSDAEVAARIELLDYLRKHGLLFPGMDERNYEPHGLIDALVAAVRAETIRFMHELDDAADADSRLTVVKLRDDETSPVAAPCAIAGACQYGEARRCPVCGIQMTCLHPASHLLR